MRYIYKCSLQEGQAQLYSPVMMRLAEVYLNRAEAEYHLNDQAAAVADVNVIRTRAGIPVRDLKDANDPDEVLTWILNERRLELAWEGQRKYDIFRNGQTLDRNYPGYHITSQPSILSVKPTDDIIVEYLPQTELDAYPGGTLLQNP
jgi:hypothetical protein